MPTFSKKDLKNVSYNKTLDSTHREHLRKFSLQENNIIPTLKRERTALKSGIKQAPHDIDANIIRNDRIKEICAQIRSLNRSKHKYYMDNSKHIFDYFEDKKNIDKTGEPTNGEGNARVFTFFKISAGEQDSPNHQDQPNTTNPTTSVVNKYMKNVDSSFIDKACLSSTSDECCKKCGVGELVSVDDEGVLICSECFVMVPHLIETEKPSYKEAPKEVCFYAYKRINHFKEIVAQFQGKETTHISDEVISRIKCQILKERISVDQLTYARTKDILKKLSLNKYYEHIAFIKNKLGVSPPTFSSELEDVLYNLFTEIQSPYAANCPSYRVNFLPYYFVLYKFCQLLNETQYLAEIPMLKDREKLIEQDEVWHKICVILNWDFIPTI
jgi:hypothetical protein